MRGNSAVHERDGYGLLTTFFMDNVTRKVWIFKAYTNCELWTGANGHAWRNKMRPVNMQNLYAGNKGSILDNRSTLTNDYKYVKNSLRTIF